MMTFIQFGSMDALIFFAAYLNKNGGLTIGDFTSFQFYMFSFLLNFTTIAQVVGDVMGVLGTTEAIAEILDYEPSINIEGGDEVTAETLDNGEITIKDIKFHYPTKPDVPIIKEASIKVPKNKTIALVGHSGCGKSTIIQLLERFYDPISGSISYGNQNIRDLDPKSFKKHMAIVQQEPILFSGTIRENITYGLDYEPKDSELDEACRMANALTFLQDKTNFPLGYETVVGERGLKLSGGQKQRVAIARALIRKPKILLLDEATSALDTESEHQVQKALDSVLKNSELSQTVVVIAHRLSTIMDADEIIVLNKGVIVERGTHQ
jgi:ABC-type multidrug transport system fused ATPase/permease subunit